MACARVRGCSSRGGFAVREFSVSSTQRTTFSLTGLLTIFAAGFAGWAVSEATHTQPPSRESPTEAGQTIPPPLELVLPAKILTTVHPGMPRVHVEHCLRDLPGGEVEPVDTASGPHVSRVRYRIHLAHPIPCLELPVPFRPGPYVVMLEFDGQHPAQPLIHMTAVPEEGF
jgi:hypothetical protein